MIDAGARPRSTPALDDPRVVAALDAYMSAVEKGHRLDRDEFLSRHAAVADVLAPCLDGMEMLHGLDAGPESTGAALGTLGDFRIMREVGRGGMGVVYEAEQISLGRRVALKVLPFASTLDPKQLQRFKNEAQAAAHLHHQHIVPVYATGCERGVHYYAMQYVEGQTLAALIAELRRLAGRETESTQSAPSPVAEPTGPYVPGALPSSSTPQPAALTTESSVKDPDFFRTVARLGVQAAEALEHAHQLGIVHRDVKPANLLVEAFSTVPPLTREVVDEGPHLWITDFGLAQVQSHASLTLTGDLVGTVRYMSPEQTLAKRGMLDHRTDIYSLGVTLYELLTLEPAFNGCDRHEVIHQIAFEEPVQPRRLNEAVPAELETIVLKAMEKNPAERYDTAQEYADDLERFLKDEPIRAKRPSFIHRSRKWARRHKTLVRAGWIFLLAAVVGLSLSTWLIWREKDRVEAAHESEAEQKRRAEEKRELAEVNVRVAIQVLDRIYLRVVEEGLPRDPQREEEHHELLRNALPFYEQLAAVNSTDATARLEAGRAYLRVGDIQAKLGQHAKAEEAYEKAIDGLKNVADEFPDELATRQYLAIGHHARGLLLREISSLSGAKRLPESEQSLREAATRRRKLVEDFPKEHVFRADLAATLDLLHWVLRDQGRPEADKLRDQAQEVMKAYVEEFPENSFSRNLIGIMDVNAAIQHKNRGELERARFLLEEAIGHHEAAVAADRQRADYADHLRQDCSALGGVLQEMGKLAEAKKLYERQVSLADEMVKKYPRVPAYRVALAQSQNEFALLLGISGQPRQAEKAFEQAIEVYRKLADDFGDLPRYQRDLAIAQMNVGFTLERSSRVREAGKAYEQALELLKKLPAFWLERPDYQNDLASCLQNLGTVLNRTGSSAEAEKVYLEAFEIWQELARKFPESSSYEYDLARTRHNLGIVIGKSERKAEAERNYKDAIDVFQKMARRFPHEPAYRQRLANSGVGLGLLYWDQRRMADAEEAYRHALDRRRELVAEFPNVPEYQINLAETLNNLGVMLKQSRRFDEAEKIYEQCLRVRTEVAQRFPEMPAGRRQTAGSYYNLGLLYSQTNRLREAEASYHQSEEILRKLVKEYPEELDYRYALASSLNNLALSLRDRNELAEARRHLEQALVVQRAEQKPEQQPLRHRLFVCKILINLAEVLEMLSEHAAAADALLELPRAAPPDWNANHDTAVYLLRGAQVAEKAAKIPEATRRAIMRSYAKHAEEQLRHALSLCPELAAPRSKVANTITIAGTMFGELGDWIEARKLFEEGVKCQRQALGLEPANAAFREQLLRIYGNLAESCLALDDHDAAVKAASEQPRLLPETWTGYRSAASILASCTEAAAKDVRLPEEKRKETAQAYAGQAVEMLRQAVARGYADVDSLNKESAFAPLRSREDFKKLLAELEMKARP
jgi:serine/threonine protein kinase